MGDFKGLTDKLKLKENRYVMEGGRLTIGKGVIFCGESIMIPLSAVSMVEIPEQDRNGQGGYELKIENHAGTHFYITASELGFIREIRNALLICIGDANAVYSGMQRVLVIGGNKIYGDKIAAAADIHIDSADHAEAAVPVQKNSGRTDVTAILDDEWKTLEEYALQRMKDFADKDRNHVICAALAAAAELNNREKCKLILNVSGNEALDMIIAGAPIAVKAIINKIM